LQSSVISPVRQAAPAREVSELGRPSSLQEAEAEIASLRYELDLAKRRDADQKVLLADLRRHVGVQTVPADEACADMGNLVDGLTTGAITVDELSRASVDTVVRALLADRRESAQFLPLMRAVARVVDVESLAGYEEMDDTFWAQVLAAQERSLDEMWRENTRLSRQVEQLQKHLRLVKDGATIKEQMEELLRRLETQEEMLNEFALERQVVADDEEPHVLEPSLRPTPPELRWIEDYMRRRHFASVGPSQVQQEIGQLDRVLTAALLSHWGHLLTVVSAQQRSADRCRAQSELRALQAAWHEEMARRAAAENDLEQATEEVTALRCEVRKLLGNQTKILRDTSSGKLNPKGVGKAISPMSHFGDGRDRTATFGVSSRGLAASENHPPLFINRASFGHQQARNRATKSDGPAPEGRFDDYSVHNRSALAQHVPRTAYQEHMARLRGGVG